MQKLLTILVVCISIVAVMFLAFTGKNEKAEDYNDLFRIHIISNGNAELDSKIKYEIKDSISSFLTSGLASCTCIQDAQKLIKDNLTNLEAISNSIITRNGLNYLASVKICNEFFPARLYGEYAVQSGNYNGLTITLGEGKGDNWWCVLFPPLCYYNASFSDNSNIVVYKSKLLEIIKQFYQN